MNVLLVEDDPATCMTLRSCLLKRGLRCDVAINLEEALSMLEKDSYASVLIEMSLPNSSGFDTARTISWYRVKTKILALVDKDTRVKSSALRRAGVAGYITKPVSQKGVDRVIDRLMGLA
ncbi:MAG: response regulator [Candidatus Obscuribacterales bacterium]